MDYAQLIQKTIDFIDDHITEKISVDDLAKIAGFSTYHFYRVFHSFMNVSVMEYVTRRKLQYALYDLNRGKKVIDIATEYGFETHAGFTKAFKKCFGYPPNLYRIHTPVNLPQRMYVQKIKQNKTGGIIMQPKILKKDAFKVVGYKFNTTLRNNAHTRDIPSFWHECGVEGNNYESRLYDSQHPPRHGEYGICVNTNVDTDEFSYIFGVEVTSFDKATEEMYQLEVPAATYAVFTTPAVEDTNFVESIQGTWKYILEEWFPGSGYEIDDDKLDFEFYDERCHPWEYEKMCMEIYVPVKLKK
ncbi:MAG: effector binding domain-containing protein [Anaerobacillus sp.]|uniref:AraC family transcriptional regulator n=1 Tax=Anaerobacillus sp. TaxID=1872506 RepID=UPI00391AB26E